MITFANSLDLVQNRQNVGPELCPTVWHSDSIPEIFFEKSQQMTKKKLPSMQSKT